jgi:hypothetical protein
MGMMAGGRDVQQPTQNQGFILLVLYETCLACGHLTNTYLRPRNLDFDLPLLLVFNLTSTRPTAIGHATSSANLYRLANTHRRIHGSPIIPLTATATTTTYLAVTRPSFSKAANAPSPNLNHIGA